MRSGAESADLLSLIREEHEKRDDGERAHEAQFLADDSEDEVVVRLREV